MLHKSILSGSVRNAPNQIILAVALAVTFSLCAIVFFRVFLTELGYQSVGRAWYYFRNYWDFGFAPTTLIGTVLDPFISFPVDNPYRFAWLTLGVMLLIFSSLFLYTLIKHVVEKSFAWTLVLLMSPALLLHLSYNLGNLDLFIVTLGLIAVLTMKSLPLLVMLCLVGTAVHALFLFAFFPLFVALYFDKYGLSGRTWVLAAALLIVSGIFFFVMESGVTPEEYEHLMSERAPSLNRDGSFEMFASRNDSFRATWHAERMKFGFPYFWFITVAIYVVALIYFAVPRDMKLPNRVILVAAFVAPSLLTLVTTDIYRWLSMSAFNVFLFIVYLARDSKPDRNLLAETNGERYPVLFLATMLPWTLLGPIGTTCYGECGATAFPLLKRVLEAF